MPDQPIMTTVGPTAAPLSGFAPNAPQVVQLPLSTASRATLVTDPSAHITYSALREADARTALARGLAQYLETLPPLSSATSITGAATLDPPRRRGLFAQIFETWAEPEVLAQYPCAVVRVPEGVRYTARQFVPSIRGANDASQPRQLKLPDGRALVEVTELEADLQIEIWCTDPTSRSSIVAEVEDALTPVDFMYGFRMDLPFYFGQRATYEMQSMNYAEEDVAIQRYRRALFIVRGTMPVTKLLKFPFTRPVVQTIAT